LLATQTTLNQGLISFGTPVFLPVGSRYAIVLSANGACSVRTNASSDSYSRGEPYVFDGATWESPADFQEVGFDTYVFPQGLIYTDGWAGQVLLTPLLDGRVLLTSDSQTAEVYDPATGTFTPTSNTMQVQRNSYAAVLLTCPSGDACGYHGKVLIAGGDWWDQAQNQTFTSSSAELYDPATNQFHAGREPDGRGPRPVHHDAAPRRQGAHRGRHALRPGHQQLAVGPRSRNLRSGHDVLHADLRHGGGAAAAHGHPASGGNVLIVGGWTGCCGGATAELFEPSSGGGTFRATFGGTTAGYQRAQHTATALANGDVVIAGGVAHGQISVI